MPQYHIRFSSRADLELIEAVSWYEEKSEGLGESLQSKINSCLKLILKHPKRYRKVQKGFRQVSIDKFPYSIVYFVVEDIPEIVIFSIFHHNRNPQSKFR